METNGRLTNQQPAYEWLIKSEVILQLVNDIQASKVIHRSIEPDVTVAGEYDDNPMLNSMIYDIELPYGTIREYSMNIIAANILTQVDEDGYTLTLM